MAYKNGHKWISDDHFVVWCMKLRCINTFCIIVVVGSFFIIHFTSHISSNLLLVTLECLKHWKQSSIIIIFVLLVVATERDGCCFVWMLCATHQCLSCCIDECVSVDAFDVCIYVFRTLYIWLSRGLLTVHIDDDV